MRDWEVTSDVDDSATDIRTSAPQSFVSKYYEEMRLTMEQKEDWIVSRVLEKRAAESPERAFVQFEVSQPWTFAQINQESNRFAHGLRRSGIKRHDCVLLLLPNCVEYLLLWFALNKIGAVPVCVNTESSGRFLEGPANASKAVGMITDASFLSRVRESESQIPSMRYVYVRDPRNIVASQIPSTVKVVDLDELRSEHDSNPELAVRDHRDAALIFLTGGTTGPAKSVVMTNAHVHWLAEQFASVFRLDQDDVHLSTFPFFHGSGLVMGVYACLLRRTRVVHYPSFSVSQWLERVRRHQVTTVLMLGVMMDYVFKQAPRPEDADTKLRMILAIPTAHGIKDAFIKRFNVGRIVSGYGSTELCFPVLSPYHEETPPGACGKLVDEWYEMRLVDPVTDEEVGAGEIGEAIVRPRVPLINTTGYAGQPEVTLHSMRNLWWHTNDLLKRDEEGWYYFIDRADDSIRGRS